MATRILMVITLLLATGVTASPVGDTNQQCTNQQCETINELGGAANSASARDQGNDELSLLQERIKVKSGHVVPSTNGAPLSSSGTAAVNHSWANRKTSPLNITVKTAHTTNGSVLIEASTEVGVPWNHYSYQGTLLKFHPQCRWPFPHLAPYYNRGDMCSKYDDNRHDWFCPDGCEGAIDANGAATSPWCLKKGTREYCDQTKCPNMFKSGTFDPTFDTKSEKEGSGSYLCRFQAQKTPDVGGYYMGDSMQKWVDKEQSKIDETVPKGCEWGVFNGYASSVDAHDPTKLCRVAEEAAQVPVEPTGMWVLVGTKNGAGDANFEIEVGFTSSRSATTTMEEQAGFFADVKEKASANIGFPGSGGDDDPDSANATDDDDDDDDSGGKKKKVGGSGGDGGNDLEGGDDQPDLGGLGDPKMTPPTPVTFEGGPDEIADTVKSAADAVGNGLGMAGDYTGPWKDKNGQVYDPHEDPDDNYMDKSRSKSKSKGPQGGAGGPGGGGYGVSSSHAMPITCKGYKGKMTWVYQWEVGNKFNQLKSEHFRCHYTSDGYERPPECPPKACGNTAANPYCKASDANNPGANGRDYGCIKHGPTSEGCHYFLPFGCKNHPGTYPEKTWTRDSWGEQHYGAGWNSVACLVTRKRLWKEHCGVDHAEMIWIPPADGELYFER